MKRLIAMTFILISLCFICSCKSDIHSRVSDEDWEYIYNLGYEDGQFDEYDAAYEEGYEDGHEAGMETAKYDLCTRTKEIDGIMKAFVDPYLDGEYFSNDDIFSWLEALRAEIIGLDGCISPY